MEYVLTNKGINLILRGMAGNSIVFKQVQFGNGSLSSVADANAIANPMLTVPIESITVINGYADIMCKFQNSIVSAGFRRTEVGVFTQDPDDSSKMILFAYGSSTSSEADYVPVSGDEILETQFSLMVFVGSVANVTAVINESLVYASKSYVDIHINNKENPHSVTAAQAGAAPDSHGHTFANISEKPSTYPPDSHGHTFANISEKPSTYPPTSDRRAARIIIGSSAAGYTLTDCNYICDGTNDQDEINTAITSLPTNGGKILLLDGTYNISANIAMNKADVELCGTAGTKLVFTNSACIKITGNNCSARDMALIGTQTQTSIPALLAQSCSRTEICGLRVQKAEIQLDTCTNSAVKGNFIGENNGYNWGIRLKSGSHNIVAENNLTGAYYGVSATGEKKLTISHNVADAFNECGISISTCEDTVVSGNNFSTTIGGGISGISCSSSSRILIEGNNINMDESGGYLFSCIAIYGTIKSSVVGNILRDISQYYVINIASSSSNILLANNVMISDYATKIFISSDSGGIANLNNYSYGL